MFTALELGGAQQVGQIVAHHILSFSALNDAHGLFGTESVSSHRTRYLFHVI